MPAKQKYKKKPNRKSKPEKKKIEEILGEDEVQEEELVMPIQTEEEEEEEEEVQQPKVHPTVGYKGPKQKTVEKVVVKKKKVVKEKKEASPKKWTKQMKKNTWKPGNVDKSVLIGYKNKEKISKKVHTLAKELYKSKNEQDKHLTLQSIKSLMKEEYGCKRVSHESLVLAAQVAHIIIKSVGKKLKSKIASNKIAVDQKDKKFAITTKDVKQVFMELNLGGYLN